jgi:hypothetical protein
MIPALFATTTGLSNAYPLTQRRPSVAKDVIEAFSGLTEPWKAIACRLHPWPQAAHCGQVFGREHKDARAAGTCYQGPKSAELSDRHRSTGDDR